MRDLWRLLFVGAVMLAGLGAMARPAMAQIDFAQDGRPIGDTCTVQHNVAGYLLMVTRYPAEPARERAYVSLGQISADGHNLWLSWSSDTMLGGAPTGSLLVSADLFAGRGKDSAIRLQLRGDGRSYPLPATMRINGGETSDNVTMADWAAADRFFAGVDAVELVLTSGAREVLVMPLSFEKLRRTLALIPQIRTAAAGLMADPAKDCLVSNRSPTLSDHDSLHGFDCDERWTDDRGNFRVSADRVEWSIDLGDHVQLEFSYDGRFMGKRDLARDGFPPHDVAEPRIRVNFEHDLPFGEGIGIANLNNDGRAEYQWIGGEVRVGNVAYQSWLPSDSHFTINWSEWPRLMQGEGDISVAAFDVRKGEIIRKTLPRDILARIEAGMKTAQALVRDKEWGPATRCSLYFAEITTTEGPRIPGVAVPRGKRRR